MIHERHWPAFHVAVTKPISGPTKEPIGAGAMPSSEPGGIRQGGASSLDMRSRLAVRVYLN